MIHPSDIIRLHTIFASNNMIEADDGIISYVVCGLSGADTNRVTNDGMQFTILIGDYRLQPDCTRLLPSAVVSLSYIATGKDIPSTSLRPVMLPVRSETATINTVSLYFTKINDEFVEWLPLEELESDTLSVGRTPTGLLVKLLEYSLVAIDEKTELVVLDIPLSKLRKNPYNLTVNAQRLALNLTI